MSNKRAVAEVIGALLMIALAVTGGVLVYAYSSGLMGSLYGAKVQQPYAEQVSLDYYAWSITKNNVNLTLRNTGSAQVTLADFFIAGNPITNPTVGCPNHIVKVNSTCSVTLHYSGLQFTQGISYSVKAVTNDGAVFDFACIAGTAS